MGDLDPMSDIFLFPEVLRFQWQRHQAQRPLRADVPPENLWGEGLVFSLTWSKLKTFLDHRLEGLVLVIFASSNIWVTQSWPISTSVCGWWKLGNSTPIADFAAHFMVCPVRIRQTRKSRWIWRSWQLLHFSGGWWRFYPWKNGDLNVFRNKLVIELDMIISCWRWSQVILVVERGIMGYI